MQHYALANPETSEVKEYSANADPNVMTRPPWKWLPLEDTMPRPTATQKLLAPVVTVFPDRVTRVWSVRDYTPAELDSFSDNKIDAIDVLMVKVAHNHENRIRALESKPPITMQQFRAALKAML